MSGRRRVDDPQHVRAQYADASNLDARARLHAWYGTNERGWLAWVMDRVLATQPDAVLDVGGGPGHLWASEGSRLRGDELLVHTDLSPGMVAQARDRTHRHCRHAVASAEALPFASWSFDVAVANHMLYHVPDVDLGVSELARVLRPGGRLLASTNGSGHMQQLGRLHNKGDFSITNFSLETGAAILARHFAHVTLDVFDDALVVTEAQPIVDYISSMADFWVGTAREDEIKEQVARVIADEGAFRIDKRVGLFTATST